MNIEELAKQAGCGNIVSMPHISALERFAALVRAEVLDEAAGLVDRNALHCQDDGLLQVVLKSNAAAIRALKGKK